MRLLHKPIPLGAPKQPGEVEYDTLELSRLRRSAINFQRIVLASLILMVAAGVVAAVVGATNDAHIRRDAKNSRDRDLGNLVGVCAIQNVTRIEITNAFIRMNQAGFGSGVPDAQRAAVFDAIKAEFQPVDCKALVPKPDQVKLCLEYPTTIPTPGETTPPTTAQPACGK